ncbi:hypothetical protein BRD19_09720 [Halobacteriales archaeon SW_7_65_23]|nr:MAG: hypothetical protein BRD19_09720 [Halobacteriales archaeon SW_7_65_23]
MAEWHPENPAEYLGEEYADRHPASGYWKVMMKLDDPEFGRSGPGDLPDAMKEHYFQEDE